MGHLTHHSHSRDLLLVELQEQWFSYHDLHLGLWLPCLQNEHHLMMGHLCVCVRVRTCACMFMCMHVHVHVEKGESKIAKWEASWREERTILTLSFPSGWNCKSSGSPTATSTAASGCLVSRTNTTWRWDIWHTILTLGIFCWWNYKSSGSPTMTSTSASGCLVHRMNTTWRWDCVCVCVCWGRGGGGHMHVEKEGSKIVKWKAFRVTWREEHTILTLSFPTCWNCKRSGSLTPTSGCLVSRTNITWRWDICVCACVCVHMHACSCACEKGRE